MGLFGAPFFWATTSARRGPRRLRMLGLSARTRWALHVRGTSQRRRFAQGTLGKREGHLLNVLAEPGACSPPHAYAGPGPGNRTLSDLGPVHRDVRLRERTVSAMDQLKPRPTAICALAVISHGYLWQATPRWPPPSKYRVLSTQHSAHRRHKASGGELNRMDSATLNKESKQ